MTANQINYAKHLEDVRSHKANEVAATRQAQAAERQASVAEANAVTNRLNADINRENSLINQSAVGAQWYGAQANAAYQRAMADVSAAQAREAQRHNAATEELNLLGTMADTLVKKYTTDVQSKTSKDNTQSTNITSQRNVDVQTQTQKETTVTKGWFDTIAHLIGVAGSLGATVLK